MRFTPAAAPNTFIYSAYTDSNLVSGYDTINGFKIGTDKIDLSSFASSSAHLVISTAGTANSA